MSINEDEARHYWNGTKDCIEWSYFEDGFDKAVEIVGTCMQCDYLNTDECMIGDLINHVSKNSFYCAAFDKKVN